MSCGDDCSCNESARVAPETWQEELSALLEGTDADPELVLGMARDARRLVAGELGEEAFLERYADVDAAVDLDEFEFDAADLPTADELEEASDAGSLADALAVFEGDGGRPRRDVMKKMTAGAAFLGLGAWATVDDGPDPEAAVGAAAVDDGPDREMQWGMVIDLEGCDGCLSCVVACHQEHQWELGANWMYVLDFEDSTPGGSRNRLVRPCQHCTDAPCEQVCPTTARHTRPQDGLVLTDYDICIGCRYCQVGCPYGVNYFAWEHPETPDEELDPDHVYDDRGQRVDMRPPIGVMGKCTFCPTRQDGNKGEERVGSTACEDACPPEVIQFGDMNDPDSDPNQYLQAVEEEEMDDAGYGDGRRSTFKLLENMGTNPSVTYVGNEPGPNAEQVEGPIAYEDVGHVDERKNVLDTDTVQFQTSF